MANRYKGKEVLEALCNMITEANISNNVYTRTRPTATEKMDEFIVIRLPQGIDPYADTHNIAYVQFNCFARDRQGGIVNENVIESMVEGVTSLMPFDTDLMSCNSTPVILEVKTDGMGFHSVIIQIKIVIKV